MFLYWPVLQNIYEYCMIEERVIKKGNYIIDNTSDIFFPFTIWKFTQNNQKCLKKIKPLNIKNHEHNEP